MLNKFLFLSVATTLFLGTQGHAQTNYYTSNKNADNLCYVTQKKKPGKSTVGADPLFPIKVTRDIYQVTPDNAGAAFTLDFPHSADLLTEAHLDAASCMGRVNFSYGISESNDGVSYNSIASSKNLQLSDDDYKYSDNTLNPNKAYKATWNGFNPLPGATKATQVASLYCLNGVQKCTNVCQASQVQTTAQGDSSNVFKVGLCTPDKGATPPGFKAFYETYYTGQSSPDMYKKSPKYGLSYFTNGFETDGIDQAKIADRIQQAQPYIETLVSVPNIYTWYKKRVAQLASTPQIYGKMADTCYEETKARFLSCNTKKLTDHVNITMEKMRLGKGTYPIKVQIMPTFFYVTNTTGGKGKTLAAGLTYHGRIYASNSAANLTGVDDVKDIMCWEMGNLFAEAIGYHPQTIAQEVGYTYPCDKIK